MRVIIIGLLVALSVVTAEAQPVRTSGSITAVNGAVTLRVGTQNGTATAIISGTFVATLTFQVSADCTTYVANPRTEVFSTGVLGSTTTTTGEYSIPLSGFQCVRVIATAYTSGTATVVLGATGGVMRPGGIAAADNLANPTTSGSLTYNMCFDGTTWDRCLTSTITEVTEGATETASAVGTYGLTVRRDTAASSTGTSGQNATFNTNDVGALWTAPSSATNGGCTPGKLIAAATTNATVIKASAGQLYSISAGNQNAATRYLKLYNKATAPTVGTDTPVHVLALDASDGHTELMIPVGMQFTAGIAFAITTGIADTDTGAVAASEINISWCSR